MAMHVVLSLLATLACFPSAQEPPKSVEAAAKEELKYPTFQPFVGSRLFSFIAGESEKGDLAKYVTQAEDIAKAKKKASEADEVLSGREKKPGAASAELLPALPENQRPIYPLLPVVMIKLKPLWDAQSWNESQMTLAGQAAQIMGCVKGAPALSFKPGEDASNRAELEKLVRWFHATTAKPEYLAAMIFTMDAGPYAGLAYETDKVLESNATKALDEHAQLRLAKVEREGEAWVMQCVRDEKLVWSRVVSGAPSGAVAEVRFADTKPMALGLYGSKVYLQVDWSRGKQQALMYLDAQGHLLFYYLSK